MSDVQDILGFEKKSNNAQSQPQAAVEDILHKKKGTMKKKAKRPEGMSREVYNLGGATMASADVSVQPTSSPKIGIASKSTQSNENLLFKEKRKMTKRAVVEWVWKPFRTSSRQDQFTFNHWARIEEPIDDYHFSKFNKKLSVFEYNDEQYQKYFNNDPNWTKSDTDSLWQLCKDFDLRFPVIHDRFPNPAKSVDDLKDRYYQISQKLLELNATPGEDLTQHPLKKFPFHRETEIDRKRQYEALYNRSKEQCQEEDKLINEMKRIESGMRKGGRGRKKANAGTSLITMDRNIPGMSMDRSIPTSINSDISSPLKSNSSPSLNKSSPSLTEPKKEKVGPVLRSVALLTPLPNVNAKAHKKLDEILWELGVGMRPMPTSSIEKHFNKLRTDISLLLELQKAVATKEYQIQQLRDQQNPSTPSAFSSILSPSTPTTQQSSLNNTLIIGAPSTPTQQQPTTPTPFK